jgi:hypothetical protein
MDTVRCVGCGKYIEEGSKAFRIAKGRLTDGTFSESKGWGEMHEPCFEGAVKSPDLAWARIQKLAKQALTVGKKRQRAWDYPI